MVAIWIKLYRSIKQLLKGLVNLSVVFAGSYIMIILPIFYQLEMLLDLYRFLQWLSYIIIHSRSRF